MKLPDVSILKTLAQGPEARALEKARACVAEGRVERAIEALAAALSRNPEHEGLLLENARCLLTASREADAGECLKKILRRNPRRIDVVLEFIEEVKMKNPAVGTFYDAVAEHYIRLEEFSRAVDTMDRMPPEELRVYQGRNQAKWDAVRKNSPQAKLTKMPLYSAYYVALAHERLGDYPRAARAYQELMERNPEESERISGRLVGILSRDYQNLPLRFALVDLLLKAHQPKEAVKHLEQSLEIDAAGAAPEVAARLEELVREKPGDPDLLWLLARTRRAEGKYPEMLFCLKTLHELGARQAETIQLLEELTPKMEEHPPLRIALADAYLAAGKPVLAVEAILLATEKLGDEATVQALEKVIATHPDHPRTYLLLGDLDFKAGRGEKGVERYQKALALSPEDGPVLVPKLLAMLEAGTASAPAISFCLARIFCQQGERGRAALLLRHRLRNTASGSAAAEVVAATREALVAEPGHFGLRLALSEALIASGDAAEAVPILASLAPAEPARAGEVLRALSLAARAAVPAARAALAAFKEAERAGILPVAALFGQGEAALHAGEIATAIQAFRDLAGKAPERLDQVRQIFETLLARHPETMEVRYILAGLYLDRKDYASAAGELKKIRTLNPDLLSPVLTRYRTYLKAEPSNFELRIGLSAALLLSGQFEEVQGLAAETLRMKDDESTAALHLDLGDVALERQDFTGAVKRYYNASRKNPALGAETVRRLERVLDLHPNLALASLALGKTLPETGRVGEAVGRLLEAFRNDPRISEGVLAELDKIRSAHPVASEAAAARVEVFCAMGRDEAALEAMQSLLDCQPDSARSILPRLEAMQARAPRAASTHLVLARAQRALGEPGRAAEACRAAYRVDQACAPQVIRICSEMIAESPKAVAPYVVMAEIYLADGETQAAADKLAQAASRAEGPVDEILPLLEEIVGKDSGTARLAVLAAEILCRAGRFAPAARAYRKALERDPALLDAVLKGLNALLEKEPGVGEARLNRAVVYGMRQESEPALDDLEAAFRLSPGLAPEIIQEAKRLHERGVRELRLITLLSDLLLTAERHEEAAEVLESGRSGAGAGQLGLLVRLWRARLARGEMGLARKTLAEAEQLAPDRNVLLARVHETVVAQLRREAATMRERIARGEPQAADTPRLAGCLLTLGETGEALGLTGRAAGTLEASDLLNIHSEAALQEADFFRAAEILKPLGPQRRLAFAAERSGDFILACRTLEQLSAKSPDPEIRAALQRAYRRLVLHELEPGRQKLVGETILRFGD